MSRSTIGARVSRCVGHRSLLSRGLISIRRRAANWFALAHENRGRRRRRLPGMHPHLLGTLADQHRARLLAGADAHNLVATTRRVPGGPRGESRGAWDMVWADGAALHVRPVALADVDRLRG